MNEIMIGKTYHLETIRCTIKAAQEMFNENKEFQLLLKEIPSDEKIPSGKF